MKKAFVAAAVLCLSNVAFAQTSPWTFFAKIGQAYGDSSSEVAGGTYVGGSRFSVKAGSGNSVAAGVGYALTQNLDLSLSVGYEKATTAASNGELAFTRIPVELMLFNNIGSNWRIGAGARLLNSAKLETTGVAAGYDQTYDNSVGAVIEAQYLTDRGGNPYGRFGVSLRYVVDQYDGKAPASQPSNYSITNPPFNGNHIGLSLIYMY
jgi:hypothetical protein